MLNELGSNRDRRGRDSLGVQINSRDKSLIFYSLSIPSHVMSSEIFLGSQTLFGLVGPLDIPTCRACVKKLFSVPCDALHRFTEDMGSWDRRVRNQTPAAKLGAMHIRRFTARQREFVPDAAKENSKTSVVSIVYDTLSIR